jgi:hypothetical protein
VNGHDCDCIPCRARRAGVGPAPWTPAQWALINPVADDIGDPVKNDAAVLRAEKERDAAREAFDITDEAWLQATQAQATAEIRGQLGGNKAYVSYGNGLGRLKTAEDMAAETALQEAVEQATERRNDAWARVVKANAAIAKAQHSARVRLALAEARGR